MNNQDILLAENGKFKNMAELFDKMGLTGVEQAYDQLLRGKTLTPESLSRAISRSLEETREIVSTYGEIDQQGQIAGFLGISLFETKHKMFVNGKVIYTWCAADTLLFPKFLDFSAKVTSEDPISGELVELSVNGDYLEWTNPVPLYISWMEKADSCDIRNSFCYHSYFFSSQDTANKWLKENPSGKISKAEDFFSFSAGVSCC
ncbi:MAG: organomercurial lyase [Cyclobacteriaceae bacterium]